MVEPILYASLGALVATLLGLLFLPIFWRRAVRLTTKRLIDRLPVSTSEIVAAQDRLRAEVAMSMRETERKAERIVTEATRDRVDSARARATELGHLADLADLRSQISALEAEGIKIRGERDKSGADAAAAFAALEEARAASTQAAKDLQSARQDASAARSATEQARIEAGERETEVAALRAKLMMLGGESRASVPARQADGAPRMPHVDQPPTQDRAASTPPAVDAAALSALRRRLDEVADQIVRAAEESAELSKTEPAKPEQAAKEAATASADRPAPRRFLPNVAAHSGVDASV